MDAKKPSYRSIVSEELSDVQEVVLHFKEWEDIAECVEKHMSKPCIQSCEQPNVGRLNFLNDFADYIMQLTHEVKEYYGFHGVANEISVDKVIDCFDKSITIDVKDDGSNNDNSSDEEETFS